MEEYMIMLILLGIAIVLCGPIALIVSITTLNKLGRLEYQLRKKSALKEHGLQTEKTKTPAPPPVIPKPVPLSEMKPLIKPKPVQPQKIPMHTQTDLDLKKEVATTATSELTKKDNAGLEQMIGTRLVLIAGVITIFFGVAFFLKYAYETFSIGPMGRVISVAIGGLIALIIGEITRRRDYEVVAKGVTALGFALLYAAVFSAYRYYGLIGTLPGFALSILITAGAMAYAFALDEILIAFISLLGGFLTPVIVSTGENKPALLFSYTLVLGIGAIACAYKRRWTPVNVLSMAGSYLLYAGWYFKFYRPGTLEQLIKNPQLLTAIGWLCLFFAIYLILPVLYELTKKLQTNKINVVLIAINAGITIYFLWDILHFQHRYWLASGALAMGLAHLIVLWMAYLSNSKDQELQAVLLTIAISFITLALPLYFKMHALTMAWAIEAVILTVIGLKYDSIINHIAGGVTFLLSCGNLICHLPMHATPFRLIANPVFGTWVLVALSGYVLHLLYRNSKLDEELSGQIAQIGYIAMMVIMGLALSMEWFCHCKYNLHLIKELGIHFSKGMIPIFGATMLLPLLKPISPKGQICKGFTALIGLSGSAYTVAAFSMIYSENFRIFANHEFVIALLFVAALFAVGIFFSRIKDEKYNSALAELFAVTGLVVLWLLLTEEIYLYWHCINKYAERLPNWRFLAHMYISIMWAAYGAVLMAIGFWKKNTVLRYIALGLFVLLLAKVFIVDTSEVESIYRVGAFLATGMVLVGVSYLYQFLKKKGFFEALLNENVTLNKDNNA
ncbi:MAG: DUF2339 domain-containing protein [Sedimentisphaerales bacterium]|nr:DUF2339 domain-containing protein [Sedimentisphaerales bacterium]